MYTILIFIHILSAVSSIGPFFVLLPLVERMKEAERPVLAAQIATFKSAIRIVKHAGHVLVLSGALLIWQGPWGWTTSWIVLTITIMVGSVVFLASAFSPVLRQFKKPGADQQATCRKLRTSLWLYILILLAMLWLMVDKPMLW